MAEDHRKLDEDYGCTKMKIVGWNWKPKTENQDGNSETPKEMKTIINTITCMSETA